MDDKMLDQFVMNLSTIYQQVPKEIRELTEHTEIKLEMEKITSNKLWTKLWTKITSNKSWTKALQIEQLMVPLLQREMLDIVLAKNLLLAKEKFEAEPTVAYYKEQLAALQQSDPAAAEKGKHLLLLQLVHQLQQPQWKQYCLDKAWKITGKTIVIFAAIFIISVVAIDYKFITESKWIITALVSGCLGASFSMAINLQKKSKTLSLNMLAAMQEWYYPFVRLSIGASASLLFLFFLQSELLYNINGMLPKPWDQHSASVNSSVGGNNEKQADNDKEERNQLALLIIWCVIAGFSETLIPNLLSQTENQATGQITAAPTSKAQSAVAPALTSEEENQPTSTAAKANQPAGQATSGKTQIAAS